MRGIAYLALVFAASCASNTPRPLPENTVPAAWEEQVAHAAETSTAAAWWRAFDDPVLDSLIVRAQKQSLDLAIAETRIKEARAAADGAFAELWPQLDAGAGASAARERNNFQLSANLSWEIDLFGRLRDEERAAVADERALQADKEAVELLLLAEVAEAYVEYRLRRVQLALSLKTAEAQQGTVRITEARFNEGTASRFDLERALSALALTRARIPAAEELAASARHRMATLLAEPPSSLTKSLAADRPLPETDPLETMASPAEAVARRPDVRSAEWALLAALARLDSAEALRYPRLTLSGVAGFQSENLKDLFDPASVIGSIGAGLLAPIFDFGRIRAQIDIADARQERAYLEYERTVRTALEEAQTAIIFYARGVVRQKELGNALASAQKAADFARIQYREGTLSLLEVLEAERSLNEAELSWSQATADVSVRLIGIHRALGG